MKTIEISEDTYEKIKDQLLGSEKINLASFGDMIGQNFYFRTVTFHLVGKVKKILGNFVELEESSWVADSGRFQQALSEGSLDEVELCGQGFVNMEAVTDFYPWKHDLPDKQK